MSKFICKECEGEGRIEDTCGHCAGSGEGMHDGSRCRVCRGHGVQWSDCDECDNAGHVEDPNRVFSRKVGQGCGFKGCCGVYGEELQMNDSERTSILNWMRSGDTGVSSETMALIATGATEGDFDAPYDPADFGRCYRLVKANPVIKESFLNISALVPQFTPILLNWDKCCKIFERDFPTGKSDELFKMINKWRGMR